MGTDQYSHWGGSRLQPVPAAQLSCADESFQALHHHPFPQRSENQLSVMNLDWPFWEEGGRTIPT